MPRPPSMDCPRPSREQTPSRNAASWKHRRPPSTSRAWVGHVAPLSLPRTGPGFPLIGLSTKDGAAPKERVAAFGADVDPDTYRRDIWPKKKKVTLSQMVEATGYSKGYDSSVWAGKFTPHVSTWPALANLVGLDLSEGVSRWAPDEQV